MVSESPQQIHWLDIMACTHCRHYEWVGTHAASQFCQNKDSPFYDHSALEYIGTRLTVAQELSGCEKLQLNGLKIPPDVFKYVPKESQLRQMPLHEIVAGYSEDMDLDTDKTVAGLTRRRQAQYDKLLRVLEKADGPISTEELNRRMLSDE